MSSGINRIDVDEKEMLIISLNRAIPLNHLILMHRLDNELNECISTKYDDIRNIIYLKFGIYYATSTIQSILNLLKYEQSARSMFSLENTKELIEEYSNDHRFITHTSSHTITPFTLLCLSCRAPLKIQFKEKVNVFLNENVENGVIYSATCCLMEYYSNSFIKASKRFVTLESIYDKRYIHFGGKTVITIDVLMRYASDLINTVSTDDCCCLMINEMSFNSISLIEMFFGNIF